MNQNMLQKLPFKLLLLVLACVWIPPSVFAQDAPPAEEIPLEGCDGLPVAKVQINGTELRFLVDTAATTMLNLKSFSSGRVKEIEVTSWNGTSATSAREVTVHELALGSHRLQNLKLPAIDLSPIGTACGGKIDGILGVDLIGKMGVTIDLKRQVASLGAGPVNPRAAYDQMEESMAPCMSAFDQGKAKEFAKCLDPQIVMYTPHGEFVGPKQVIEYMQNRFFRFAPNAHYTTKLREVQAFGDALWYSYDYVLDSPVEHREGHGMAMCRKSAGRWRILNMHNSRLETEPQLQP